MFYRISHLIIFSVIVFLSPLTLKADGLSDLPIKEINGRTYYYYDVKPKDTEYSLCRRFGITRDQLLDFNPSQRDGLKAYATLYFPTDIFDAKVDANIEPQPSVEINPEVVSAPDVSENVEDNNVETPIETLIMEDNLNEIVPGEQIFADNDTVFDPEDNSLKISILLPLETKSPNPSKLAQLYTDFYRGFLMGVLEESSKGTPVNLKVFDTAISDEEYSNLLENEDIISTDLFIGPDSETRLSMLAEKANETGASIINAFVVNDALYESNGSMVQTNIPRDKMYAGAISQFLELYKQYTPVFIARVDGEADKVSFTDQLKEKLKEEGRPFKDIVYTGVLTMEDFAPLKLDDNYVFIPVSASRAEFGKFIQGLKEFSATAKRESGDASLFGFPEWTTFRGEQLEQLKDMRTTIYSRFSEPDNYESTRLFNDYKKWYGNEWTDTEPNQALLGYDIARYAISNLRRGDGDFVPSALRPYSGIQSTFRLENIFEGGGFVNNALYFITFRHGAAPFIDIINVSTTPELAR